MKHVSALLLIGSWVLVWMNTSLSVAIGYTALNVVCIVIELALEAERVR